MPPFPNINVMGGQTRLAQIASDLIKRGLLEVDLSGRIYLKGKKVLEVLRGQRERLSRSQKGLDGRNLP